MRTLADSSSMSSGSGWSGRFFSTSNFDLWYFCSLLIYKNVQYLIWKIWFISVWRMKAKAMAWLLTWFMIAQSTLISYHTEAFVKTESACTVIHVLYYTYNTMDFLMQYNWLVVIIMNDIQSCFKIVHLFQHFLFMQFHNFF